MTEQQMLNYLYWLKDRGQSFVTTRSPDLFEDSAKEELNEHVSSSPDLLPEASKEKVKIKVLFLSTKALEHEESAMLQRIAQALQFPEGSYFTHVGLYADAEADFDAEAVVGLGVPIRDHAFSLTIPHPRDMLADPQLKVAAWSDLQKLKKIL